MGKLYLAIAFILAGSSVIAAQFISAYLPPFSTTFFSLIFAIFTALLFSGRQMLLTARQMSKKRWQALILQAIFGSFLFRVFLTVGLQYVGPTEAGVITGASPAITALLTWMLLREALTAATIIGVLLTFAGILLVQGFPFAVSMAGFHPLGAFLVCCAAACEAFFTTLSRKIHLETQNEPPLPPLVQAGIVSLLAMIFSIVPTLLEQPWAALGTLPFSGWLALVWYGSIVTIVAFACMFAGAKRCSGYTIAAFAGLIPISSTVLSVLILKESIHMYQITGCGLVVLATLVISRREKMEG